MKIAVLTAGPSLMSTWTEARARDYDRVMAVNGAAWHFSSDYVAFIDRIVFEAMHSGEAKMPRRGWVTHENWPLPAGLERLILPLYRVQYGRVSGDAVDASGCTECQTTFPSALMAARDLADGGPIDLFGFDCTAEPNVLGKVDHDGYGPRRWCIELPWVKCAWGPNITIHGNASADVRAYLGAK